MLCAALSVLVAQVSPNDVRREAEILLESKRTPGIVVVVRHKGRTVLNYSGGYADLERRVKMRADSVHELASVSKQFTAVAAMRLVDQGKLKLDSRLSEFVADAPAPWSEITVRHLLNHTSGLPDYMGPGFNLRADTTAEVLLNGLKTRPLTFAPGSKFEYSNSGYMALGVVVAKVSGKPFVEAAQESVLKPARMETAVPASPFDLVVNRANGYDRTRTGFANEQFVSQPLSQLGDGWLMASANDLLRWHDALRREQILKPETWQQVFAPVNAPDERGGPAAYGFGFVIERAGPKPRVSHSGGWIGTSTYLESDLNSDSCVIILANASGVALGPVIERAKRLIAAP